MFLNTSPASEIPFVIQLKVGSIELFPRQAKILFKLIK